MNRDDDRAAALRVRNLLMQDTRSEKNGIDEERHLVKPKPGDFLPDVMKEGMGDPPPPPAPQPTPPVDAVPA